MTTPNEQTVLQAHQNGTLLAHMFETDSLSSKELTPFLDVLSGKEKAYFVNDFRDVTATVDGYRGLATTALKAGKPVNLWTLCSNVGLLFDANDHANVKPFLVSSADINSRIKNSGSTFTYIDRPEHQNFTNMAVMQGKSIDRSQTKSDITIDLDNELEMQQRIKSARLALPEFWNMLDTMRWEDYVRYHPRPLMNTGISGINEVNAIAHMRGVKGIIISKNSLKASKENQSAEFTEGVQKADALRKQMLSQYTNLLPPDLPIIVYDAKAKEQLYILTPEEIEKPFIYWQSSNKASTPNSRY